MSKDQSRPSIQSPRVTLKSHQIFFNFEPKRDAYGFTVRPQHLERYREYENIYKEEEEERLQKWKSFLERQVEFTQTHFSNSVSIQTIDAEVTTQPADDTRRSTEDGDDSIGEKTIFEVPTASNTEKDVQASDLQKEASTSVKGKSRAVQTWVEIRPSLSAIDHMMSFRIKKSKSMKDVLETPPHSHLRSVEESRRSSGDCEEENGGEFYENEMADNNINTLAMESSVCESVSAEPFFPWIEELEFLVRGGVPRDIRGEVWQAFVGARARRVERYYQNLLAPESDAGNNSKHDKSLPSMDSKGYSGERIDVPEKSRKQIEKDLPRTFPGHPAMDENGRNSLRRLLLAYARHNPSVGYCQAMNFFAGILLLMMPEENAFWTLVGIMDDYFGGYFSEEMIESQVDQLVFEELMRERFPKLVNHLDYLGMQVAWISGPWFLSIFVNLLPWESVLRVWDVLLFEGNRVMLFRTALALMELYGPALSTTKDAGDAITLLQSLTGSTFDSSQLVLTACMGFSTITEETLQTLREKHRLAVLEAVEERSKEVEIWKDRKGLATKLYSFKHDPGSLIKEAKCNGESGNKTIDADISLSGSRSANKDDFLYGLKIDSEIDSLPDLQAQVVWLKVELSRFLEEKRVAELRAEELEIALMEIVKQDNRREMSARIEQLEQEVTELRQALADKKEQENAMLQVLMRVEQEQKVTEDARISAEQDAAAQRFAVHVLQEKYEKTMATIAQMEKRVVIAESKLEAMLHHESGQTKASSSPRSLHPTSSQDMPARKPGLLSFGLGWRDRNKGKSSNPGAGATSESKSADEGRETSSSDAQTNGPQE